MDGQEGGGYLNFASIFSLGFRTGRRQSSGHSKSQGHVAKSNSTARPVRKVLCRYGMGCTHVTDPLHRERFWHPPVPGSALASARAEAPACVEGQGERGHGEVVLHCHECGVVFTELEELQLHLKRKTAWSNKSLVGCRISCLVDNREWHDGLVLEFSPITGKHRVSLEHLGEARWLQMLRMAFFIVQRPPPPRPAAPELSESKELEADNVARGRAWEGPPLAPLEPWTFEEDISLEYARAQAVIHWAYGGRIQETGHKTQGHLCVTEEDKALAKDAKSSLLYGELLPRGINKAMVQERLCGADAKVVYELGMGIGKVAMQVFLQFPNLSRVYGVELSAARFSMAVTSAVSLVKALPEEFELTALEPGRRVQVRSRATGGVLDMEVGNLLATQNMEAADIVLLETDLAASIYHDLCKLLRQMKRGARAFTYLDLRKIWTAGPFPFRQLDINRPISDRYATSWSVNRGHHFFLWSKVLDASGAPALEAPDTISLSNANANGNGKSNSSTSASQHGHDEGLEAGATSDSTPERHRYAKDISRRRGSSGDHPCAGQQGRRASHHHNHHHNHHHHRHQHVDSPRGPFGTLSRAFRRLWRAGADSPTGVHEVDRSVDALSKAGPPEAAHAPPDATP